jgi:hypothetical protein
MAEFTQVWPENRFLWAMEAKSACFGGFFSLFFRFLVYFELKNSVKKMPKFVRFLAFLMGFFEFFEAIFEVLVCFFGVF